MAALNPVDFWIDEYGITRRWTKPANPVLRVSGPTFHDLMQPGFHSQEPSTWHSTKSKGTSKVVNEENEKELSPEDILAGVLTEHYRNSPSSFMLGEPATITVQKPDGSFSKRPHIGGEMFKPTRAYVGKRGMMIHVMKPESVTDYATIEVNHTDAKKYFGAAFTSYFNKADNGEAERKRVELAKQAADEAERKQLESRSAVYADLGFASW